MVTLYDVPAEALNDTLAEKLTEQGVVEEPEWATHVKTGAGRELPPEQPGFWARRCASLLRKVAVDGPVGVNSLRTEYGDTARGSNRYRVAPDRSTKASGKIIRTALNQLEDAGFVESEGSAGRIVTAEGRSLLDETAGEVLEDLDRPDLERYA